MNTRGLLLLLGPCSQPRSLPGPPLQGTFPHGSCQHLQITADNLQLICPRSPPGLTRRASTVQGRAARGGLRVIDVIPQHVQSVVHAAAEVEAMEVLGEVLPPAHVQQVAGELVKALQLCSGGGRGRESDFLRDSARSPGLAGSTC